MTTLLVLVGVAVVCLVTAGAVVFDGVRNRREFHPSGVDHGGALLLLLTLGLMFGLMALDCHWDVYSPRLVTGTVRRAYLDVRDTSGFTYYRARGRTVAVYQHSIQTRRLVELDTPEGLQVVEVRDSVWLWDWSATETFAAFQAGRTLTVEVGGVRSPFFRLFPRVNRVLD